MLSGIVVAQLGDRSLHTLMQVVIILPKDGYAKMSLSVIWCCHRHKICLFRRIA
jgi:hypothetical protein